MYNVEHKRDVLINESLNDSGNYYKYLKALYNLFYNRISESDKDYATKNDISFKEKKNAVLECYDKAYVSPDIIACYQKDLTRLGYFSVENVNGEWRTYINRELDF